MPATALSLFKETVIADIRRKLPGRGEIPAQVLDAAILKMWADANPPTKAFFEEAAQRKSEWERIRGASSSEDQQAAVPEGGVDESKSAVESDDDDDDEGSRYHSTRAGPVATGADDGSPGQDVTETSTFNKNSDAGSSRRGSDTNITTTATAHHEVSHTNHDDAIIGDSDGDGGGAGTRPPTKTMTRPRAASDEAQAKNAGRPEKKQKSRKSTPDTAAVGDETENGMAGKPASPVTMVTRFRAGAEAQAKNTGRSEEKQKARKSSPDDVGRDDNTDMPDRRRLDGVTASSPVPTMAGKSSESVTPLAEPKLPTPASGTRAPEAMDRASATESGSPAARTTHGGATELGPTAKIATHNTRQSIVKTSAASAKKAKSEQGGLRGAGSEAKKPRRRLSPVAPGEKQAATSKHTKRGTQQPSEPPREPLALDGPNTSSPGSPDHPAFVPSTTTTVSAAPSASAPRANGEQGDAAPKRGRGRPRKVAPRGNISVSVARRLEAEESRLDEAATVSTKQRGGGENGGTFQTAVATSATGVTTSERDPRDAPTGGGMRSAGEVLKPSRPRGRPRKKTTSSPGTTVALKAGIAAASRGSQGDAQQETRRTLGVQGEATLHKKLSSAGGTISGGGHADRSEESIPATSSTTRAGVPVANTDGQAKPTARKGPRGSTGIGPVPPVSASTLGTVNHPSRRDFVGRMPVATTRSSAKKKSGGSKNVENAAVSTADGELSVAPGKAGRTTEVAGKPRKGGDGVEVTGADEGDGGVTGSAVFGVARQKAAVIEVLWEVDVQTVGRNTEKKWQWFTASVDLTKPCGFDDEGRMEWKTEYARTGGLAKHKSKIVFLSKDTLWDALQGYMEGPLQWREKEANWT